jgi:hypothetical protein
MVHVRTAINLTEWTRLKKNAYLTRVILQRKSNFQVGTVKHAIVTLTLMMLEKIV